MSCNATPDRITVNLLIQSGPSGVQTGLPPIFELGLPGSRMNAAGFIPGGSILRQHPMEASSDATTAAHAHAHAHAAAKCVHRLDRALAR